MFQDGRSRQKLVNLARIHLLKAIFLKIVFVPFILSGLLASPRLFADEGPGQNILGIALPWSGLQSNFQSLLREEVAAKKTFRVPSQIVEVDGIDLKVGEIEGFLGGEAPVVAVNHLGITVKGASLDLEGRVNGISIDQVLERNFDGHHIRIRIQAQCEPFSLRISKGGVISRYSWQTTNQGLQIHPETFELHFQPELVSIGEIKCLGLEGLGPEVRLNLFANIKNPARLEVLLRTEIEKKVNALLKEQWLLFQVGSQYRIQENGILIFRVSGLSLDFDPEILSYQIGSNDQGTHLVLTEKNLNQLILQQIQQVSRRKINLNEIPDFQKLLKSRFLQFFVWPDLMNFPKLAKFEGETTSVDMLSLSKSGQGYSVRGVVNSAVRGERKRLLRDYLVLSNKISAQVEVQVSDGQMFLDIHNSRSEMKWAFAKSYQIEFSPSPRISASIIRKLNDNLTQDRRVSMDLLTFEVGGRVWKIKGVNYRGGFAEFSVAPIQK
jgi:hypothetical protein